MKTVFLTIAGGASAFAATHGGELENYISDRVLPYGAADVSSASYATREIGALDIACDEAWRGVREKLAADPRRRSLPSCRRARRLWAWAVLAVAVIAVTTVCACHFLHSGKVRFVSVREGVVSVEDAVAPGKIDVSSEKGEGATERSIDSIFFVP